MASPYSILGESASEYRQPGFTDALREANAAKSVDLLDSQFVNKFRSYTNEPSMDDIIDMAIDDVDQKYPGVDESRAKELIKGRVRTYLEKLGKEKAINKAAIGAAIKAGVARELSDIQPSEGNIKILQAGRTWAPDEGDVVSRIAQNTSINYDTRKRIYEHHINDSWDMASDEDVDIVKRYMDEARQAGAPTKREGWFGKFGDTVTASGRAAVGGLITGPLRSLEKLDNGPFLIPDEAKRNELDEQWEQEEKIYREIINSGAAIQAPIKTHANTSVFGLNMKKAIGAFVENPGLLKQVVEDSKLAALRGWDKPDTPEASLAAFLSDRLGKFWDASVKKASEETGIDPAEESSWEQESLKEKAEEIFRWALKRDAGSDLMENPVAAQLIAEILLDPLNIAGTLIKAPMAVVRGVTGLGAKLPGAAGKMMEGAKAASEEFAKVPGMWARQSARKLMEKSGIGHVPESMQFEDIARAVPDKAEEARAMKFIMRGAPGMSMKLAKSENKMWKLADKIRSAGGEDIQRLLFKAQDGDLDALTALKGYKGKQGVKIQEAMVAMRQLADEHWTYMHNTNQYRVFSEETGLLEEASRIDSSRYIPHVNDRDMHGYTSWLEGAQYRTRNLAKGPRSMYHRTGGEAPMVENAFEAWRRTLHGTTGRTGRAATVVSEVMKHAQYNGFAKTFKWDNPDKYLTQLANAGESEAIDLVIAASSGDKIATQAIARLVETNPKIGKIASDALSAMHSNDAAKTFAEVKTAATGVEWGSLDHMVNRELQYLGQEGSRLLGGNTTTGAADYVRRVIGKDFGIAKGNAVMVVPRPLARQMAQEIMMRGVGPASETLHGLLSIIKPIQGIARAAWTVPSLAFQVSQLMTSPFTSFIAHGPKGLSPTLQWDAARLAWYSVLRRNPLWQKIPGINNLLGKDVERIAGRVLEYRGGARKASEIIDFAEEHGLLGTHTSRFGIDLAMQSQREMGLAGGQARHLSHAGEYLRKGLDVFYQPAYWMNDFIDGQQKMVAFLGAIKNPNDVNDLYRSLEFARRWAVGNVSGTGIGPTERYMREAFGFYGFTRWTHQWFASMLTDPNRLRWFADTIKAEQALERKWGGQAPVYAEAVAPGKQHMVTAPPFMQPDKDEQIGRGPHQFTMMQLESPMTLLKSTIRNVESLFKRGKLDPEEAARMAGPAAHHIAGVLLGYDPETGEKNSLPWLPDDTVPFLMSKSGQMVMTPFQRPIKEFMDVWRYADPDTPEDQISLAMRLAARNSGKGIEYLARYIRTGEWPERDESLLEVALSAAFRFYPNSPLWEMAKRKKLAMEAMQSTEKQARAGIRAVPDSMFVEDQPQMEMTP